MSNSKLVSFTRISPNSTARTAKIDRITIHHMASNLTIEACGAGFADPARQASSNYGIGTDGRIGMYVEENRRAWTSSNRDNDNRAITIEVANDSRGPDWHVSDKALAALVDLCTDICQRNNIKELTFTGKLEGSNLTMHKWFAATQCPGPYLGSKFPYVALEVNKRLGAMHKEPVVSTPANSCDLYRIQVGAFSKKAYAQRKLEAVKSAGFEDAFLAVVDSKLWRVQIGAFEDRANAEKRMAQVTAAGFTGYITKLCGTVETAPTLQEGSTVRLTKGAKTYTGGDLASFVYNRDHKVTQLTGDRAVISYGGVVVAAVHKKDLVLV